MSDEKRPDIVAGAKVSPFVPRDFDEALRYARMVLVAGAVPESLRTDHGRALPDQEVVSRVVAVISAGSEVGLPPMAAMANIALINNRRFIWGEAALALLHASGELEDMQTEKIGRQPENDTPTTQFSLDFGIRVTLKRKGRASPFVGEFTVGMAKRANLWLNTKKLPWIEHPERQMFWRAFHRAATDGFSDVLMGLGIRELADDAPPPPPLTDTSFLDAAPPPAEPVAAQEALPDTAMADQSASAVDAPPQSERERARIVPEEETRSPPTLPLGRPPARTPSLAELRPRRTRGGVNWVGYAAAMIEGIANIDDIAELRAIRQSPTLALLRPNDQERWVAIRDALDERERALGGGEK